MHVSKIAGFHVGVTRFFTTATCSLLQNLPTRNATQGLPCVAGQAASGDLMWTGDLLPSKISPSLAVWIRGSGFETLVLGGKWETTSSPLNIQKQDVPRIVGVALHFPPNGKRTALSLYGIS